MGLWGSYINSFKNSHLQFWDLIILIMLLLTLLKWFKISSFGFSHSSGLISIPIILYILSVFIKIGLP